MLTCSLAALFCRGRGVLWSWSWVEAERRDVFVFCSSSDDVFDSFDSLVVLADRANVPANPATTHIAPYSVVHAAVFYWSTFPKH